MTEQGIVVSVAVGQTNYGFDKLYDYAVPPELEESLKPGCRVKVSFGHGQRQGMVMSRQQAESTEGLKAVSTQIDEEPVLSEELLQMAGFMKSRYYCTYYEACMAMLPTGLSVKLTYSYMLSEGAEPAGMLLDETEAAVCQYLKTRRTAVREDRLMGHVALTDRELLRRLTEKGILVRTETVKKRIADATVKMIRLRGAIPDRKYSPQQREVLRVLEEAGEASVREICYFTGVSAAVPDNLVKRGICEYYEAVPPREKEVSKEDTEQQQVIELTAQQQRAYEYLSKEYHSGKPSVTLLYGVTGSGKTSVFMKLIDEVTAQGKGVICMVPEISLTPQMIAKFKARYGDRIAVFHSGLALGQRLDEWKRVREGRATIAVGTRSAIFAPIEHLGLIVMDEEQEYSYKSSASPRFHARELAKFRCNANACPLVLSSATPSVESYEYALTGRYGLCRLEQRYGRARLPHVITVDMNLEQDQGNYSGYSSLLLEALEENLSQHHQSILLLNRRGHNTFIACRKCNEVITCPNCSISLTYHSANHRLMCHYCGYSIPVPQSCPACGSEKIRYSGAGTQRACQELTEIFPEARILRLDTDATMQRYAYEKKLRAFRDGEYDIMLGTQMVAKGLDFENVTLVGVLSADGMMHNEDYRSYERTFSLLTQVVGRSGRGGLEGRAIIQTSEPQNPIIELAAAQNYDAFFRSEIALRKTMLYPPYADIAVVAFIGEDQQLTQQAADYFASLLREMMDSSYRDLPMRMLGPAPAAVARVSGKYRFRVILKFRNSRRFREMLSSLLSAFYRSRRFRDVSAYADIDPDSIL